MYMYDLCEPVSSDDLTGAFFFLTMIHGTLAQETPERNAVHCIPVILSIHTVQLFTSS